MASGVQRPFLQRHAAWLTLVVGLALTATVGWQMHREAVVMDQQRLAVRAAEIASHLDTRLEKTETLLRQLQDYLLFSGENRNQVFAEWCYSNGLSINCPWVHGIAVATNRHAPQWRDKLPTPPATWTEAEWTLLHELSRQQIIECDIALKSEVKGNKRFLPDYDLKRLVRDDESLAQAIRGPRLDMSKRRLVMMDGSSNKLVGTLFYVPVYQPALGELLAVKKLVRDHTRAARWMHLTSVILAPIDFNELAQSVWDGVSSDLGLELFSSTNQTAETWLNISPGIPRAADPKFKAYLTHRRRWPMYGKVFSIFFYTTPLFEAQSPRRLAKIAMAAGTTLTFLATALVGVALRARNRQESMTEQIREARDALAAAQLERNKISRDLHDGTIQSLYAMQIRLGHMVEKLAADPHTASHELSAVRSDLDMVIAEIRQFITADDMTEKPVDFRGVLYALVQRARAGTTAQLTLRCELGAADRLVPAHAVQLANIAREALSNSLRHGQPKQVQLVLRSEREAVILEIADDGVGFTPKSPQGPGVGLASMLARAQEVGGTLEIQSAPGNGTRLVVRVPASPLESPEPNGRSINR